MIAQEFRQLNVYCRHLCFMKTGHDINCCVFKYLECIIVIAKDVYLSSFESNAGDLARSDRKFAIF